MGLAAYLMANPHSNMIGIYDLPVEYIHYDMGLSDETIREMLILFEDEQFAFYDHETTTIYIPTYAAIQVAPTLKPQDNRSKAIQSEIDRTSHTRFLEMFLARYAKPYCIPIHSEEASSGSAVPSKKPKIAKFVDNPVDNKGLARDCEGTLSCPDLVIVPAPVPVIVPDYAPVKGVKRGLGREEENPPPSKARQFFESWPDHMMSQSRKNH